MGVQPARRRLRCGSFLGLLPTVTKTQINDLAHCHENEFRLWQGRLCGTATFVPIVPIVLIAMMVPFVPFALVATVAPVVFLVPGQRNSWDNPDKRDMRDKRFASFVPVVAVVPIILSVLRGRNAMSLFNAQIESKESRLEPTIFKIYFDVLVFEKKNKRDRESWLPTCQRERQRIERDRELIV